MLHVITSNPITVKSLSDYHDNFIIVHVTDMMVPVLANPEVGYSFKIYHQDGMDVEEYDEYEDTLTMKFEFIPVTSIKEALSKIADDLIEAEDKNDQIAEEKDIPKDQIMVACVCNSRKLTKLAVKYVNNDIKEDTSDIQVVDMYQYFKIPSEDKMVNFVKTTLETEFVYPEDPIAYGYALHRLLGGTI